MRIIVIAHYQGDGSPCASFIHNQVKALQQLGNEIVVLSPISVKKQNAIINSNIGCSQRKVIDGILYIYIKFLSFSKYGEKNLNFKSFIATLKFSHEWKFLNANGFDLIHAHTFGLDCQIGGYLKGVWGIPLVITSHGGDTFERYNAGKIDLLKEYAKNVDAVCCVSNKLKKTVEKFCDCNVIEVIHNGFEIKKYTEKCKKELIINQTNALIPQKNTDKTLRALKSIRQSMSMCMVISGDGPERKNLEKYCVENDLSDFVTFTGNIGNEEVIKYMASSKYFVMPSINEGLGIVYLEAMSQECITIGSKNEGIEDIIIDGENGFLIDSDDFMRIVEIILDCEQNPEKTQIIAKNARSSVEKLTWERNAMQYIVLYESIKSQSDGNGFKNKKR